MKLVSIIEKELVKRKTIEKYSMSEELFEEFTKSSKEIQNTVGPLLELICDKPLLYEKNQFFSITQKNRIQVCRLIPLLFYLHTNDPCWSSFLLRKYVLTISKIPNCCWSDLCCAFLDIIEDYNCQLTQTVYNFFDALWQTFAGINLSLLREIHILKFWTVPPIIKPASAYFLFRFSALVPFSEKNFIQILEALLPLEEYWTEVILDSEEDLKQKYIIKISSDWLTRGKLSKKQIEILKENDIL